jgi:hypothetical protein
MAENGFPWHPTLEDMKTEFDLELGQVGEIDRENQVVVYRPRNNGIPTAFVAQYEIVDGKYRLTGKIDVFEFHRSPG